MFDAISTEILRSAPPLKDLDPTTIPEVLTRHYVRLASARLGSTEPANNEHWSLEKLADAYEIIATVESEPLRRRSAAFVAATAHQIISRDVKLDQSKSLLANVTRDHLNSSLSACLLFIIAEQYADASEAAKEILFDLSESYESRIIAEFIKDIARGNLASIVKNGAYRNTAIIQDGVNLESRALGALLRLIADGIIILSHECLGLEVRADQGLVRQSSLAIFRMAAEWSAPFPLPTLSTPGPVGSYSGTFHLAHLLVIAGDVLRNNSIARVPSPPGTDSTRWERWISHRANSFPFVWPNHRTAIEKEFHYLGRSAVLVLPTGAGKTTVSSLKIAAVISSGKRVVFLAPTHALAEQLTDDLQEMFPHSDVESTVSADFDMPENEYSQFPIIEVMTPERCLASMAYSPQRYQDVGLLVFDECHILSAAGRGGIRRSIDGMLCVLAFVKLAPLADLLFLSAMLKDGSEIADWVSSITRRDCLSIDLLWKPSRQARGVIAYELADIRSALGDAATIQESLDRRHGKTSPKVRAPAMREIQAVPYAIWGLQHNWLNPSGHGPSVSIHKILDEKVQLGATLRAGSIYETPNSNTVASTLAVQAAKQGIKTIIFVNNKTHAVKTAREISARHPHTFEQPDAIRKRWEALEAELGSIQHSVLNGLGSAVPHNASMFRLERDIAERTYRHPEGAKVIVATPTLAQGLNLPAQLAILAGDKRMDGKDRIDLEAHEILNAAARAGRAGHLANGLVLLIPEPVIKFIRKRPLPQAAILKIQSLLPEDDRCVRIVDPLEIVLDRLTLSDFEDADVKYVINRMAASMLKDADDDTERESAFDIRRSFMAYKLLRDGQEGKLQERITMFASAVAELSSFSADKAIASLASQTGLSMEVLGELRGRLVADLASLPDAIPDWLDWLFKWFLESEAARTEFLQSSYEAIQSCTNVDLEGSPLDTSILEAIIQPSHLWIKGAPVAEIERALGGYPVGGTDTAQLCPRARELITTVIGRGLSYAASIIAMIALKLEPTSARENFSVESIESFAMSLRRGFDSYQKLRYSQNHPDILSRVQIHTSFKATEDSYWV